MWKLVLFISTIGADAFLQKPKAAEKVVAPDSDVAKLSNKLDHVIAGLDNVYKAQSEGKNGVSRFGQLLKPYLTQMHEVMNEVKSDKKLNDAQKMEKLHNVEASVTGLKKDMDKLTTTLKTEGEEEKESILLGVLMSRKGKSEKEQMEVLESNDFKNLAVVKYVLAHRDAKKSWAEQVAARLDATTKATGGNHTVVKTLAAETEGIVKQLSGFLKTMEKHLADQEKFHKKITAEHAQTVKDEEAKLKTLEGKDKNMANKTVTEEKQKTSRTIKIIKRRQKKEDRMYLKQHGMMSKDVDALKKAIEAVKRGDMSELAKMQGVLQQSMKAMQGGSDFLHFLQLQAWTDHSKACPYCKAQCLEKCHNGGHSFMQCMTECENVGN